jgi:hypothetical protein
MPAPPDDHDDDVVFRCTMAGNLFWNNKKDQNNNGIIL